MKPSDLIIIPLKETSTQRQRGTKLPVPEITEADLTTIRESMGLSKNMFAEVLAIDYQTLRKWELGVTKPTPLVRLFFHMLQQPGKFTNQIWLQNFRNYQPGSLRAAPNPTKRLSLQRLRSLKSSIPASATKRLGSGTKPKPKKR